MMIELNNWFLGDYYFQLFWAFLEKKNPKNQTKKTKNCVAVSDVATGCVD